jgi:hypothetical protein
MHSAKLPKIMFLIMQSVFKYQKIENFAKLTAKVFKISLLLQIKYSDSKNWMRRPAHLDAHPKHENLQACDGLRRPAGSFRTLI